jgi:hypothetical protein
MRNKIFIFIFALAAHQCWSQLGEIKSGKPFNTTKKENFSGFIGENDLTLFTIDYLYINRKKQELNLRRFSKSDLQLMEEVNIFSIIDEEYTNEPKEIFYNRDSIYLFSTLVSDKQKFALISLEIFNQYGERLQQKIVDTISLDDKLTIAESDSKKHFLLATHNRYNNLFEQQLELISINSKGELEWKKAIKSPIALQNLSIEALKYGKNGRVYALCNYGYDIGKTEREETDLINNKYALWAYNPQQNFLKEIELKFQNKWAYGVQMKLNKANELLISGYMNETRNHAINGVFSLKIDDNFELSNTNYYLFKRSFFAKFLTGKELERQKELKDISLRNLVLFEDDSYFLIGEQFYQQTERYYDPRTNITTTTENYYYNSILVSYFDAMGNHQWSERIPKYQHSINDNGYYSSFSLMQNKHSVYLFFNDTDKNNELELDDYFNYAGIFNNRRFQITAVMLSKDGIKRRQVLIDTDNDFLLRATQSYQINQRIMYLSAEQGKARRIFAVEVKN